MKKILFIISCLFLVGCTKQPSVVSDTEFILNTICTITINSENNKDKTAQELIEESFELCKEYEKELSRTINASDISNINNSNNTPVQVSQSTIEVIERALYYSELTNGAFDITVAPLSILWDFQGLDPKVPDSEAISTLLQCVDYNNVIIANDTVVLSSPTTAIDLGGIAKGYIADKVAEYLNENGVTSAIIDLGGNIYLLGSRVDGNDFNTGIKDPKTNDGSIIGYMSLSNKSVVTSGSYERCFEQDGIIYHHILDPDTGYPTTNELISVTIISDSSADGDALSTSCFVLGVEEGLALINSIDNVEAVFINEDDTLYFSDGFGSTIQYIEYE